MIIYITEPGAYLRKDGKRMKVEKNGEKMAEYPLQQVEAVVLFGGVQVSSQLMVFFLEEGIAVNWFSPRGSYYGRLEPTVRINIERQREQFRRAEDEDFCLELARSFIRGKLHNSEVVLRRYNRSLGAEQVERHIGAIKAFGGKLEHAANIEQLLGYEGSASRAYFAALGLMVNEAFRFDSRSKQPPLDPFNSMLSFGYTLLMYEINIAVTNKGLHPYMGFLHKIRHGHPALASDLMEEWRPVIVDSLVMSLVQNERVKPDFFERTEEGGVYMKHEYRKDFIAHYESKIRQENSYLEYLGHPVDYREAIQEQAMCLVHAIEEADPSLYSSVRIR